MSKKPKVSYKELEQENVRLQIDARSRELIIDLMQGVRTGRRFVCCHCLTEITKGGALEESRRNMVHHVNSCEKNPLVIRIKELEAEVMKLVKMDEL